MCGGGGGGVVKGGGETNRTSCNYRKKDRRDKFQQFGHQKCFQRKSVSTLLLKEESADCIIQSGV